VAEGVVVLFSGFCGWHRPSGTWGCLTRVPHAEARGYSASRLRRDAASHWGLGPARLEIDFGEKFAHEFADALRGDAVVVLQCKGMVGLFEAEVRALVITLRVDVHLKV
jgi:hypothetical protein